MKIIRIARKLIVRGVIAYILITLLMNFITAGKRSTYEVSHAYDEGKDPETGYTIVPGTGSSSGSSDAPVHTSETEESVECIDTSRIKGVVKSVIDGDTMWITIKENGLSVDKKVRLIGVDTPESVHVDESRNVAEGKTASDFTKSLLLPGYEVELELDVSPEDMYGRTLAYVYFQGKMVQDILLSEGMARTMTIAPNVAYADHFVEVQREAERNGKGFWKDYFKSDSN